MIASFETSSPRRSTRNESSAIAREPSATGARHASLIHPKQATAAAIETDALEQDTVSRTGQLHTRPPAHMCYRS
jgi:hypothetical protein